MNSAEIPDLRFVVNSFHCQAPHTAARSLFDYSRIARFVDPDVNGRRARFSENVFWRSANRRIVEVRSVADQATAEPQSPC